MTDLLPRSSWDSKSVTDYPLPAVEKLAAVVQAGGSTPTRRIRDGSHTPHHDIDESDVEVHGPKHAAAGVTAVAVSMKRALNQMGPTRTAKTLLKLNQTDGFDCMSCAWPDPDPDHRHTAEFCENGAKAVAEEATKARVDPELLRPALRRGPRRPHGVLAGQAGPDHRADGAARGCHALHPDRLGRGVRAGRRPAARTRPAPTRRCSTPPAGHRTRPRSPTSSSPARFGTNNLPDCSNMCHESTSIALQESIGIGKASVAMQDVLRRQADRDHGPEPRHQPPADADRARAGEEERREDPGDQPAQGGRLRPLPQPADPARGQRDRHRARRPAPARADQRRPRAAAGDRRRCCSSGAASTGTSSSGTPSASTTGPRTCAAVDWPPSSAATGLSRAQIERGRRDVPRLRPPP